MSDMTDTVGDFPLRFAALEAAHRHVSSSSRCQDTALPLPQPVAPVMLVRYRPGNNRGQATRAVHLAPIPNRHVAGTIGTLCGAHLSFEDIEAVTSSQACPAQCAFSTT
jgi:hypothetical protein